MATKLHASLTADADIHEPKGVTNASIGQAYIADGVGSGSYTSQTSIVEQAIYKYHDLTTQTTPIPITLSGTLYDLTNDGAGANTDLNYKYSDVDNLWDTATDRFDFSGMSLGDVIELQVVFNVTTTNNNTELYVQLEAGIGGTPETAILFPIVNIKNAGTIPLSKTFYLPMLSTNIKDNPARLQMASDDTGVTVEVDTWTIIPRRNVNAFQ